MVPLHIQLANSTLRRVTKRLHFPLEIMLVSVRWYAAYPLSLRNLEEMMAERGVLVDHSTVHRWALKFLPVLATVLRRRKLPVGPSWWVDETYVLVGGQWKYLYRAVDKLGQTVDFLLTAHRDVAAARRFFERAIGLHDVPASITIDKSGANTAAVRGFIADSGAPIELRQSKYLNNIVEQDHRAIKRIVRPMLGFKTFRCADILIAGIEIMHMIKKHQLEGAKRSKSVSCGPVLLSGFLIGRPTVAVFGQMPLSRQNQSQHMRWFREGSDSEVQVRVALQNHEFDALSRQHFGWSVSWRIAWPWKQASHPF